MRNDSMLRSRKYRRVSRSSGPQLEQIEGRFLPGDALLSGLLGAWAAGSILTPWNRDLGVVEDLSERRAYELAEPLQFAPDGGWPVVDSAEHEIMVTNEPAVGDALQTSG